MRSFRPGTATERASAAMSSARVSGVAGGAGRRPRRGVSVAQCACASATRAGPLAGFRNMCDEIDAQRFVGAEGARFTEYGAGVIGADTMRQPAGAQHHAKAQAGQAERGAGRGNAPAARGHQIGASAENLAMRQHQRFERRVMHRLQQRLDAEEAQRQIAFAVILIAAEIKPRAEMIARAVEHQQPRAVGVGVIDGVDQRVHQRGRQQHWPWPGGSASRA